MAFPIMLAFIAGLCMNGSAKNGMIIYIIVTFAWGLFLGFAIWKKTS